MQTSRTVAATGGIWAIFAPIYRVASTILTILIAGLIAFSLYRSNAQLKQSSWLAGLREHERAAQVQASLRSAQLLSSLISEQQQEVRNFSGLPQEAMSAEAGDKLVRRYLLGEPMNFADALELNRARLNPQLTPAPPQLLLEAIATAFALERYLAPSIATAAELTQHAFFEDAETRLLRLAQSAQEPERRLARIGLARLYGLAVDIQN